MVGKRAIAVIPARGGSKRIPHKNIIDFMGKPMIAWTIEAAIKSQIFFRIVVSTDDETIKNISIKYGAEVPFLREKYIDDYAPVSEATLDAIKNLESFNNEKYDIVVQLMPNCPLRNEKVIKESYEHFIKSNSKFQISCFKFGWMNPWWAFKIDEAEVPTLLFQETLKGRSQDLDTLYCPTGAIWIAETRELERSNTFYGKGYSAYPINWKEAIDIDDMDDLEMAKALYTIAKI